VLIRGTSNIIVVAFKAPCWGRAASQYPVQALQQNGSTTGRARRRNAIQCNIGGAKAPVLTTVTVAPLRLPVQGEMTICPADGLSELVTIRTRTGSSRPDGSCHQYIVRGVWNKLQQRLQCAALPSSSPTKVRESKDRLWLRELIFPKCSTSCLLRFLGPDIISSPHG
jgi:hypothetical protein